MIPTFVASSTRTRRWRWPGVSEMKPACSLSSLPAKLQAGRRTGAGVVTELSELVPLVERIGGGVDQAYVLGWGCKFML